MKRWMAAAVLFLSLGVMHVSSAASYSASAPVSLWRLDCGRIEASNLDVYSDAYFYEGRSKKLVTSCYLIQHGDRYLLWDAGLSRSALGKPLQAGFFTFQLDKTISDQLAMLGVTPDQITYLGISHRHPDHLGQAADFPGAILLMGQEDFDAVRASPDDAPSLARWTSGSSKAEPVAKDRDVFGDGSVIILDTPGHTPGHQSLLVRLKERGNILITGDIYHFREQVKKEGIPRANSNRADTLASMHRLKALEKTLHATSVIPHDPDDIARLPAFPQAAR